MPLHLRALLLLVLFGCWSFPGAALESAPVVSPRATASLVSDVDTIVPGRPFHLGLRLRLAPGWHTYWRNPGDAGVPPEFTLDLPQGASAGPIAWPAPARIAEGPLTTYAYTGELLLPVSVVPPPSGDVVVKAHADWLVCREICVPEEGEFRMELPVGSGEPSAQAALFAASERQVPRASPWDAVVNREGTLWVRGPELNPNTVADAWFIPDAPGSIRDGAVQPLTVWDGGFTLGLRPGKAFSAVQGLSGILSVRDRSGAESSFELHAAPGTVPAPVTMRLGRILALAFAGGLILNLMPCVFPILALKAVALTGAARGKAQTQALAYTAGVLVAFACLGAALLAARAAGTAAGWGFQFQSPVFVAAMAWLLFGVGLNLSGVYEIGTGLVRAGHGLTARPALLGSFFTGLLAVIVATPCTAPFMGVAIAAGLAAPATVTMAVFLVMGLGLAAPYALLAMVPAVWRVAPRPGRWMEVLRQSLAFPMYAASAWLVWVVSEEAGSPGVLATVAGLVMLGFAGWVIGLTQTGSSRSRRIGQTATAVALLAAVTVLSGIAPAVHTSSAVPEAGAEKFSAARLASLRAAGQPVFVNMTAAWCVTCLLNERVAIGTEAVRRAFAERHVAYLKGDWTRQDPQISEYLHENGRDGVPLYIYYPPHGAPDVLPQILTENAVLQELERG
jgi:thiol:disulfide interchange protein DsbD